MRTRLLVTMVLLAGGALPAQAAIVVIANYTGEPVTFTVAEPGAKPRKHTLPANHVAPVYVTGPADITFRASGRDASHRIDMYNAYMFLPDQAAGVRLEGAELPEKGLERDTRAELSPIPRDPPVKVPVALYVDDCDPRAEQLWQKELRARFDEVAGVIENASGIRLEFAGFSTWKSDPEAKNLSELLTGFEEAVKTKPGTFAVGYSSRKIDEKLDPAFGVSRGLAGRHILLREWRPKNEPERVEVLLHYLAEALGAVGSPDTGSAMRGKLADGYILHAGAVLRLDPLNALALNLWADERRREPGVTLETLSPINRQRLTRIYKALLKAAPGDTLGVTYLDGLDRDFAKDPNPMVKNPDRPPVAPGKRDELARKIVKAIAEQAKRNAELGASALTGDELTQAYIRTAAQTAAGQRGPEMVSAFLIALGVALDDTGALTDDAITAGAVKDLETEAERKARLAVLGNPTLAGRRDLCRRFFLGCATGELLSPAAAERAAVGRAQFDLHKPSGLCVPVIATEFAGIAFARAVFNDPEILDDVMAKFSANDYLPPLTGLRNGFSVEKFEEVYGNTGDDRFAELLADIRKRIKTVRVYK